MQNQTNKQVLREGKRTSMSMQGQEWSLLEEFLKKNPGLSHACQMPLDSYMDPTHYLCPLIPYLAATLYGPHLFDPGSRSTGEV
jgi:hypothetical protein